MVRSNLHQQVTTLAEIAIRAGRLGMVWKDFRPDAGLLHAEGNGMIIVSTRFHGQTVVFHRQLMGYTDANQQDSYIQSTDADSMFFGIIPGDGALNIPSYKVGSLADVLQTSDSLDPTRQVSQIIQDVRRIEPRVLFGFSDLLPLAAPVMRRRGDSRIRLPIPMEYCVGLTCHQEGFVVFHHCLKRYAEYKDGSVHGQVQWIIEQYEFLKNWKEWEDEVEANKQAERFGRDPNFLDAVHSCWNEATLYLFHLQNNSYEGVPFKYHDLMAIHIRHAVSYWADAWSHIRRDDGKQPRDHYGLRDWIAEGMHVYFDYLPSIAKEMGLKGFEHPDIVYEAWFTMIFRAFCWWRLHYLNPGQDMCDAPPRVPSEYRHCQDRLLVVKTV